MHAISIGLGFVAGASWALGSMIRPEITPALEPGIARDLVSADASVHWSAVEARSAQLAAMPLLAAVVVTDAATVRDLTTNEQVLRAAPRETLELGQVHAGRTVSLLRAPASAPPAPLAHVGRWLSAGGRELRFTAVASIAPAQDAAGMRGAIAVTIAAPAAQALARLASRTTGRIVVAGAPVDIGAGLPPDGPTIEVPLDELPGAPRLILPAAIAQRPLAHALRGLSVGALLGGVAMAIAMRARGRRRRSGGRTTALGMAVPASAPPAIEPAPMSAPPASAVRPAASGLDTSSRATSIGHRAARLGRYERLSLLGEGGTSSVYLARATGDLGLERHVALKVLRAHHAHDERQRTMLLDEARVVSCIDHPNVVRIFDLGYADDQLFIAMEYLDGQDLEARLHQLRSEGRHIPLAIAVAILVRVCAGLHAAHTAVDPYGRPLRVVHRDVKPGNVLVSRNGCVKVSDFGIAKARQQAHTSLLGEARGTAAFMAPEQRLGQIVDARTDVFGVATVGYELLSNLEIDLDLARLQQYGLDGWPHLPPLHHVRPDVPPALEALLFRALAFSPADRHASCADLSADLERIAIEHRWSAGSRELAAWVSSELARRPAATSRAASADTAPTPPLSPRSR